MRVEPVNSPRSEMQNGKEEHHQVVMSLTQSEWKVSSLAFESFRVPPWSSSSVLNHRSLPPVFEFRRGHIWRLFHLWLCFITFRGRSAHLAYHVHKSGRKTSIIALQSFINHAFIPVLLVLWDVFSWVLTPLQYISWIINSSLRDD